MSKSKTLIITYSHGVPYLRAKNCGIETLIFVLDGIPQVFFGNEKTPHVRVSDAIAWHRAELPHTSGPRKKMREQVIARLEEILARPTPERPGPLDPASKLVL